MFKIFPNQIAIINVATFVWIEVKVDIKLWKVSGKDTKLRIKTYMQGKSWKNGISGFLQIFVMS